jgi:hypothetical protein
VPRKLLADTEILGYQRPSAHARAMPTPLPPSLRVAALLLYICLVKSVI